MAARVPRADGGGRPLRVCGAAIGWADFMPEPLGPRMAWAYFLNRVLRGDVVEWTTRDVPPCKVDRMLAALGLYHVRVRCVIPEELVGH